MKKQLFLALTLITCVSGVFATEAEVSKPKSNWKKYVCAGLKFTGAAAILGAMAVPLIYYSKGVLPREAFIPEEPHISRGIYNASAFSADILKFGAAGSLAGLLIASGVYDLTKNDKRLL